jgi:hypothetical protein
VARRLLAVADGDRDGALARHHVAAGEDARMAGHHAGIDRDRTVVESQSRHHGEQPQVDVLAQRQHQRIGLDGLELAGRLREAGFIQRHLLHHQRCLAGFLDGGEPLHLHAFLQGLLDLEVVRRHLLARAAVDDDRFLGAEPLGGAGDVDGGVAAAVHHDAAAEQGLLFFLHAAQHRDGVEDLAGVAGRDVGALGDVRADGEEAGVELAVFMVAGRSSTRLSSFSSTPMSRMRCTSASSTSRGRRYFGMPKRIMPPLCALASQIVTAWPAGAGARRRRARPGRNRPPARACRSRGRGRRSSRA